jgi:hypothetical protein
VGARRPLLAQHPLAVLLAHLVGDASRRELHELGELRNWAANDYRMKVLWRLIPVVLRAETRDASQRGCALLKAHKNAVVGRVTHVIHGAPRITLRFCLGDEPNCDDTDTEREQQLLQCSSPTLTHKRPSIGGITFPI